MEIGDSSMEITNILFKIMKFDEILKKSLEVSESFLQIQDNSRKFPTKFGKFGKIFTVKPKIRKKIIGNAT